jgi:hypothetical protein
MAGGTVTLLLLGIAINAASAAGLALLTALASEGQLKTLSFWMLGSFASLDWPVVIAMLGSTVLGGSILMSQSPALVAPAQSASTWPSCDFAWQLSLPRWSRRSRRSAAASDSSALRRHTSPD